MKKLSRSAWAHVRLGARTPTETPTDRTKRLATREYEVSLVIPTHNRREMLRELLTSLAYQTLAPDEFEVIVVVDGSTDGTQEMLEELETPYRLKSVYQESVRKESSVFSSGVAFARNRGGSLAQGRVLVFLDDDTLPEASLLEEHLSVHREDDEAVVLGRLLPTPTRAGKKGWTIWEEHKLATHYRLMARGDRPPDGWRLYSANFSVGRRQFWDADGFDGSLGHVRGEDVELGLRLQRAGRRFYFRPAAAAVHRGFRTFTSWSNSAHFLGRGELNLARSGWEPEIMPRVFGRYVRSRGARLLGRLFLGRKALATAFIYECRAACAILTHLRRDSLAHYGYSMIFRLRYWQGVADELGGRGVFLQRAREWQRNGLAPEWDHRAKAAIGLNNQTSKNQR